MPDRPVDTREIPEGHELVAVPDPDWRLVTTKRCRFTSNRRNCGRSSVAELNRGSAGIGFSTNRREHDWWAYCPEHMYGRWVEDGQVLHWILRETEASGAT